MSRHDRTYTVLLIVLAFFLGISIIEFAFLKRAPSTPPESRWVFEMIACINAAFVVAIVTTLILRGVAPSAGRIATTALNIILLFAFPFGTALGIYGLRKVDKAGQPGGD